MTRSTSDWPNYVQAAFEAVAAEMPEPQDPHLLRLYTLLALTKGSATTASDVHDAWAIWRRPYTPEHPHLVPFAELAPEVQELDQPFVDAIHRAVPDAPKETL